MRLALAAPISICWPPNMLPGIGPSPGRGPPMGGAMPPDLGDIAAAPMDADLDSAIGGDIPPIGEDLDCPPPSGIVEGIPDAADLDTAAAI